MLRRAGDCHAGHRCQRLDIARRLGEEVDQVKPALARQRLTDARQLSMHALLVGTFVCHVASMLSSCDRNCKYYQLIY